MRERTQSTVTAMEVAIYSRIKKSAGGCLRCLKDVYQSKQSPALHFLSTLWAINFVNNQRNFQLCLSSMRLTKGMAQFECKLLVMMSPAEISLKSYLSSIQAQKLSNRLGGSAFH